MRFTSLVVELVRARPRLIFWVVVLAQAFLWFVLPLLFYAAPPGDVPGVLAIGRDHPVGTDFGPPLAFWLADFAFRLAGGHIFGVYLLSQLCFIVMCWALFQLAHAIVSSQQAMLAVLLTVTIIAFSSPGVEFGQAVMTCPVWALTLLHAWRVMGEARRSAWFALSFDMALLLLTSQYGIVLLILLVGFALATPQGRQALRSTDTLFSAIVVLVMVTPYLAWWIRADGFAVPAMPAFFEAAARFVGWGQLLGSTLLNLSGIAILLLFNLRYFNRNPERAPVIYRPPVSLFARQFVYFFAIAPAVALTMRAAVSGSDQAFGYYGVSLLLTGLAVIVAAGERIFLRHQTVLRTVWLAVVLAPAAALVLAVFVQPWTGRADSKTSLPATDIGQFFGKTFNARVGRPLPAVAGDMQLAQLIGFAAPSRPVVAGPGALAKTGGLVVWRAADTEGLPPSEIKAQFPDLVVELPQEFARRIDGRLPPLLIGWAIVRPQDARGVK